MSRFPYHTFVLGLYAVIALLAHNITQVSFSDALPSLLLVLLAAALLLGLLRLLLKDWRRAGLVATILLLGFFLYGHIYSFLQAHPIAGFSLGRHRLFGPLWLILVAAAALWASRRSRSLEILTLALNGAGLMVMIFPLVQLGMYQARVVQAETANATAASAFDDYRLPEPAPDIYYIVLDSYPRQDVLQRVYDLDTQPFLDELRGLGFQVATCSQSNYAQTVLSLASSLNFDYLDALGVDPSATSDDRSLAVELLHHSELRQVLSRLGYQTVVLDSNFFQTQIKDADHFLSFKHSSLGGVNAFEAMLLETSAGVLVTDATALLPNNLARDIRYPHKVHRQAILYSLDRLEAMPAEIPGPKFVFAHIVAPHEPFVFGPDGEEVLVSEDALGATYAQGFSDQVTYLNKRLIPMLQAILEDSPNPPVIVLQADHGTGRSSPRDRMRILNAIYLPPGSSAQSVPGTAPVAAPSGSSFDFAQDASFDFAQDALAGQVYPSISPVNTFRVVLNSYFGANLPLLEDRSFFSPYQEPYDFREIQEPQSACP